MENALQYSFNLIEEPWITVTDSSGSTDVSGLRELLHRAHTLDGIIDPIPTVEFGLYRFLTALVMDIYDLKSSQDLKVLLRKGQFDKSTADKYFSQWADRFDLFHPVYPFLQTSGMDAESSKPIAAIMTSIPSGTAAVHFHHHSENEFGVSPSAAARMLVNIAPFMTAGGAGLSPSINGAPPWYLLVNGDSLFETICLNCCVIPLSKELSGNAPPAWRNPSPIQCDRYTEVSLLEALTWRPRKVQLIPEGSGRCSVTGQDSSVLVRKMKFSAGASCDFSWFDPSVPYKITDKGPLVMRPDEGKDIWRDTGPFTLLHEGDYVSEKGNLRFSRPRVVDQYSMLFRDSDNSVSFTIYGMRTDMKMKVFEWRRERLTLPAPLIWNTAFHTDAQNEMDRAGKVEYAIKKALKRVYPRDGAGNKKAFDTLYNNAQREFWSTLQSSYDSFLKDLADIPTREGNDDNVALCRERWHSALRSTAKAVFDRAVRDLDTDSEALRRQMEAYRSFNINLAVIFQPLAVNNNQSPKEKEG
ncbi:MAG: type I-E CRISPR-associated protein Cse1/CasA [Armatimonadota bacterium]